jgi:Chaperone of endosialidase
MQNPTYMKTNILSLILVSSLTGFAFLQPARAVVPPPDGGYPNFTTAEGTNALFNLTIGSANTAVGWFSLWGNTDGSFSTAAGAGSLLFNNGDENTAFGAAALLFNSDGFGNTAIGAGALLNNTSSDFNTAVGLDTLSSNTGDRNTATGAAALVGNTTGFNNMANGAFALLSNTEGSFNTANGVEALSGNTTGFNNTANGFNALAGNTIGTNNTANGVSALVSNTIGNGNTALGVAAGANVTTANNVITIGTAGANVSNTCFIGNIRNVTTSNNNAIPVVIDSAGQLGTLSSSRRYKKEIRPMDKASDAILALKPVTFHYKSDTKGTPQFGLIAEEVDAVIPDLVVRDEKGEIYTVRYDAVNAMLLNEFLKEHKKVEEQQATIAELKSTVAQQRKDFEAALTDLKGQIQRVSAQLELNKPAPQVAENNQ